MVQPNISVILPVHNAEGNLLQCLLSLSQTNPPPHEIIVVADGCTDRTAQRAQEAGARVVSLPIRRGPAHARNEGASYAQGDILFFVDADIMIPPDAFAKIKSAFQQDPSLVALFGSYDDEPGENNFLSQYRNLFHHYVHQISQQEASTFWSGCGAIRRPVFWELGGFQESYRKPSIEDIELGYRLKQAGYRIRLLKELQVKHLKHWGVKSLIKTDFFDRAIPWTELILKTRNFVNDLNLRLSSRLSVLLIYGLIFMLIGSGWRREFFAVACSMLFMLLVINAPVYHFFMKKRGLGFMMKTIPWHWFYYFYSGLAFGIGLSRFFLSRHRSPKSSLTAPRKVHSDPSPLSESC